MSHAKSSQFTDALEFPMPSKHDAERLILGCILLVNDLLAEVAAHLLPTDFFFPAHAKVYRAMLTLHKRTGIVDPTALADEMRAVGTLDEVGDLAFIASLYEGAPRFSNVDSYVRLVKDAATSRALIASANAAMQRAFADDVLPDEQLATLRRALDQIEARRAVANGLSGGEAVEAHLAELRTLYASDKHFLGVGTGLMELDYTLGGLQRGELIVIAARPSMGKTAAAARIVQGVAEFKLNDPGVIVAFTLEMSKAAFGSRLAYGIGKVDSQRARNKRLTRTEQGYLEEARDRIAQWPLVIFDATEAPTVQAQSAIVRQMQRQHGTINAVVVDYLGLCKFAGSNSDNENWLLDEISKQHKEIAKRFNAPVVLLSQLSRANEKRGDKRPMLSDLRSSGGIEQNADVVIFLHNEGYYDKHAIQNVTEWIVAKQRNGALRTIEMKWEPTYAWFDNREVWASV